MVQDRDEVLTVVKDWVQRGVVPERLDLDYRHPDLKTYAKVLPVLTLVDIPEDQEEPALDILVKTDIEGNVQSERYCVPSSLMVATIQDLHLKLTHFGTEIVILTLKHLVWFPNMWARVRQVLLCCPGCVQKTNKQLDKRVAGCYYPREKGNVARDCPPQPGWTDA